MNEHIKRLLNEEQDPKAIEKITSKLNDLLMRGEEVGYIGVQKKPVTVFPDSIVLTNKRIIICKPKNLGLSMDFTDYAWEDIAGIFVKENILGSEFSFSTKTDIQVSIDYIPKTQARKIYTFAKEQQDLLKNATDKTSSWSSATPTDYEIVEETPTEEVTNFAELMPSARQLVEENQVASNADLLAEEEQEEPQPESALSNLSKDALFEKLQNYKKLLDNGLITQMEYDALKKEILPFL